MNISALCMFSPSSTACDGRTSNKSGRVPALIVALVLTWAGLSTTAATAQTPHRAAIDIEQPANCAACHSTVVGEWQQSMHSRSHHDNDPIYGGMRAVRMDKQGAHIAGKCAQCHNPRSPADTDTVAAQVGVACAACHNVAAVHSGPDRIGAKAIQYRDDDLLAAGRDLPPGRSPAHPTGDAISALQDGETLCLACHNATKTLAGAAACTTGPEYSARHDKDQTCVSCHMPEVAGAVGTFGRQDQHRSHTFAGPHRAWYQNDPELLSQAVDLTARIANNNLQVHLQNRSAHAFPSGFPGRVAILQLRGKGADGASVWRNYAQDPMAEDPQAVLNKVYVNADGKPVPAPFSQKMMRDNRLRADELRTLQYALPKDVVAVEARLLYFLLPGKLATFIGLPADAVERESRVVKTITTARGETEE